MPVKITAEDQRLAEANERRQRWRRWGPYVSERQWARCARTTAPTATPGTTSRTTMRAAAPIAGARMALAGSATTSSASASRGALERHGSDPEGTAVRPDQSRGQSRRGRQGALLLSRRDADPFAMRGCSTSIRRRHFPTTGWCRRTRRRGRQQPEFELHRHRHLRRRPLLRRRHRIRQGGCRRHPDADHRHQPRPARRRALDVLPQLWFRNTWSWRRSAQKPSLTAPATAPIAVGTSRSASIAVHSKAATSCCSARTRPMSQGSSARRRARLFKDALHDYVVHGDSKAVNPAQKGTKAAGALRADDRRGRKRDDPGPADARPTAKPHRLRRFR